MPTCGVHGDASEVQEPRLHPPKEHETQGGGGHALQEWKQFRKERYFFGCIKMCMLFRITATADLSEKVQPK